MNEKLAVVFGGWMILECSSPVLEIDAGRTSNEELGLNRTLRNNEKSQTINVIERVAYLKILCITNCT